MTTSAAKAPEPTRYDRVIAQIRRAVQSLNEALGLSEAFDAAGRRTCVTFGYIGNLETSGDDRTWLVFLPHPERVGTSADSLGSFASGDLDGAAAVLAAVTGALRLARWQRGQVEAGTVPLFGAKPDDGLDTMITGPGAAAVRARLRAGDAR